MQSVNPAGRGEPWKSAAASTPAAPRPAVAGPLRHRTLWRLTSAVLFCALCGGMVWLVTWWTRPQPIRAVYLAAGYETNLAVPHNSYGRRWAADSAAATGATIAELRRDVRWDAGLRGVKSKTVLLTIAAHGGTDADGPYLLPTDAVPGPPADNRLRLKAILDRLAGLPEASKKVLVLEAGQMPANPLFGPPESDFAKGLEEIDLTAVPNLSVLTANGPGERAWPAEVHRSTAFGHFYRTGLSGAADIDGDRKVTLWELYEYLAPRVEKAALQTRASAQTPRLYPTGPEGERRARAVVVAQLANNAPAAADDVLPAFAPAPALQTAWERFANRAQQNPPPASYAPHRWRVYAASLVRAEELTVARDEPAATAMLAKVAELEARLDADRRVEVNDPLLAAAVFGPNPTSAADYDRLLDRAAEDPAKNLSAAVESIRKLDRPGRPRPPAAHLAMMLAANAPQIPAELVRTALTVRRLAETAAASGGGGYGDRLAPWFADRLKAADATRTKAEDRLFATDPGPATDEFATAKAGYAAILADAAKLRAAFQTRDRLFAELPLLANWAVHSDAADEVAKLWTAAHALDRTLSPTTAVADASQSADGLAARLDALTKAVVAEARGLLPAPPAGLSPRDGRDTIERVRSVPMLPPDVRAQLGPLADRFTRETAAATPPAAATAPGNSDRRAFDLAAAALGKTEPPSVAARVPQLADEVRRLLETDPTGDPAAVRTAFLAAERIGRLTPAGLPPYKIEPAVALRGLLAQQLALSLAERHADGLWAGDSPTEQPYYKQAAGSLLTDVATLGPIDPVRDRVGKLRGRLDVPFRPTISGTVPVTTTDPAPFTVEVTIAGERADALPGFLTLWAEPPPGLTLAGGPGRRAVPWPDTRRYSLDLSSAGTANAATAVAVRGFFRGWKIDGQAPVNLYPVPDVTDTVVPPTAAPAVSVRASPDAVRKFGSGEGAVAIVLDCSGSMAAPEGKPASESRYQQGVAAARRIIADLPRNTVVTVWVFGAAGEAQKKVDDAEKTIEKRAGPVRRDPDDAEQVGKLIGRVDTLTPFNLSPVFKALLSARDDVLTAAGYKAVVLISDGLENPTAPAETAVNQPVEPLAALLRTKLRDERVVIHAVGFPTRTKADAAAGESLRDFVETLPTPGKYVVAPDVDALSAALRSGLSSRLTARLTPAAGKPIELAVTPGGTADRWTAAKAGPHKLGTDTGTTETDVRLAAGDRLLLGLDASPAGPTFRRLTLADEFPSRPFARSDRGDWRVTVLQNQKRGDGVALLVGLEATDTSAQVTRPADVWFDLGTDFPDLAPAAVRWRPVYDYTAPVWELLAPVWPTYPGGGSLARPTLRVWFDPARSAATATTALKDVLDATAPVAMKVGAEDVTVEAIRPAQVGGPPVADGTIALRVKHAADRPVLARLDGVELASSERRVYAKAGRTIALFLPAAGADVRAAKLTLVPLTGFKATARRIDVRDLSAPDPDDNRAPTGR